MKRLAHDINKGTSAEEQKLWTLDTPSDRQKQGHIGHCREARVYTEFCILLFKLYFYFRGGGGGGKGLCICHVNAGALWSQKRVSGCLGLEFQEDMLPGMTYKQNLGPLQGQVFLTTEPSHQLLTF